MAHPLIRALVILGLTLTLAGCPPSGDPPPFTGEAIGDAEVEGDSEAPRPDDRCADTDGDGRVAVGGCDLPPGDCDPDDPRRAVGLEERCDGVDNDCDERVDEADPMAEAPCAVEGGVGPCAEGIFSCNDGQLECVLLISPSLESCNGEDDDCDGTIDEEIEGDGDRCDAEGEGICAEGVRQCESGAWRCTARAPEEERCNGVDDDCDGRTDEEDPQLEAPCEGPLPGRCRPGAQQCVDGNLRCQAFEDRRPELCNGEDDDCDGLTDERFATLGEVCTVGVGRCAQAGLLICDAEGDGVRCDAVAGDPRAEVCDGVDDDCDGLTDESAGGMPLQATCYTAAPETQGVGVCAAGVRVCQAGALGTCVSETTPSDEACDALDNDCDGTTDEGFDLGSPCTLGLGRCARDGVLRCSPEGGVRCIGEVGQPRVEQCDGFDDDCDGAVDEGFPTLGQPCAEGEGVCRQLGVVVCVGEGQETRCSAEAGEPVDEVCDGLDNDCDGRIDNGALCPSSPVSVLTQWQLSDVGCADFDGDGAGDNALSVFAVAAQPLVEQALTSATMGVLLTTEGLDAEGADALAFVTATGDPPQRLFEGYTPAAVPVSSWPSASTSPDGALLVDAEHVQIPSPLFFAPHQVGLEALNDVRGLWLRGAQLSVNLVEAEGGGLLARDGVITGAVDHQQLVTGWRRAASVCALTLSPPAACDIFAAWSVDAVQALVPDVDVDGDGTPESLSVCVSFTGDPSPDVVLPPEGGQACIADDDCLAGLSCRLLPGESADTFDVGCGLAGAGAGGDGEPCITHDDCAHGLCLEGGPWGARCASACAEAPCPQGLACRGMESGFGEGDLCVAAPGDGRPCAVDDDCNLGQLCTRWRVPGEPGLTGRCQQPGAGAAEGDRCVRGADCRRGGLSCVGELGAERCAAPCVTSSDCAPGLWCAEVAHTPGAQAGPRVAGACVPVPEGLGTGLPCVGEADCPGGETCMPRRIGGAIDPVCQAGVGFGSASQLCADDDDCASSDCVGGRCGGYCQDSAGCGPRLGCRADAFTDEVGVLGGRCDVPSALCVQDADCGADPLCQGALCVCDLGVCRLGCRYPGGICAPGLSCQADGGCDVPCADDRFEPDDERGQGHAITLSRSEPVQVSRHRLCAGAPVDHVQVDTLGQPFELRVFIDPLGHTLDDQVAIRGSLINSAGDLVEEGIVVDGQMIFSVADAEVAAQYTEPVTVQLTGSALGAGVMWRLEGEVFFDACPEDEPDEPRDDSWHWQQLLLQPGLTTEETVTGHLCPGDADWYAVSLGNGDTLTLARRWTGDGFGGVPPEDPPAITVEIWGPDFPEASGVRVITLERDDPGPLVFEPPPKVCNERLLQCEHTGLAQTDELCFADTDCVASGWFVRIVGGTPQVNAPYTFDIGVVRATDLACVPDVFENDRSILPNVRPMAGTDPRVIDLSGQFPSIVPERDVTFDRFRACGEDWDLISLGLEAGEGLRGDVRQPSPPARQLDVEVIHGPTQEPLQASTAQQETIALEVPVVEEATAYLFAARLSEGVPQETPFPLSFTVRRLRPGFSPDEGCVAPTPLIPGVGVPRRVVVAGCRLGTLHDSGPYGCIGGDGPDRVYSFPVPGPGRVEVAVTPVGDDQPVVYLRDNCDAPSSELACGEWADGVAQASTAVNAEGEIYIFVDGGPGGGDFTLEAVWSP
ncbi:MAG: MopE-related protein [Bradymonadia bacterium]